MKQLTINIAQLPTYLDGSDGSLWKARNAWELLVTDAELASRRFVRVSDMLELLAAYNINIDTAELLNSTSCGTIITTPNDETDKPQ